MPGTMDLTPLEQSPSTADQPTALLAAELVKSSPSACAAALQWLQVWLQSALVGSAEFVGSPSQEPAAKRSKSSNREGTNGSRVEKKVVSAVVDKVASAALDVHGEGRLQFAFWAAAVLQSIPTGITASNGGNVEPAMVVERGIAVLQEHTATSSLLQLLVSTLERDTDNSDSVMIRGLVDMLSISEEPSALGVLGLICIQAPEITLTALLLALLRMDTTQGEKWDRTAGMVSRVGQYAAEWFPAAFRDCVRKLLRQPAVKQAGPGLMKHFATHSEPCALAMVLKIVFEEMKDTLVAAVPLTNLKEFIQLSSSDSPSLASWPSWFSLVIKAAEIQPVLLTQFVDILATAAAARVNTSLVTEGSSTTTAPDAAQGCRQVLRLASWLAQEQVISEGGSTTHGTPLPDCRLISALSGQHLKLLETANAFADVDRNDIVHSSTLADLDILAVVSALAGSNDAPHWTLRRLLFDEGRASRHSSSRFVNAAFAFLGCGVNPFPELVTSVMSEDHLSLQLVGALLEVSEKLMIVNDCHPLRDEVSSRWSILLQSSAQLSSSSIRAAALSVVQPFAGRDCPTTLVPAVSILLRLLTERKDEHEIVRVGNILSLLAGDDVGSVFVGSGLLNTVWLRPGGPVEKEDIGSKLTIRYVFSRCMESKIGCASLASQLLLRINPQVECPSKQMYEDLLPAQSVYPYDIRVKSTMDHNDIYWQLLCQIAIQAPAELHLFTSIIASLLVSDCGLWKRAAKLQQPAMKVGSRCLLSSEEISAPLLRRTLDILQIIRDGQLAPFPLSDAVKVVEFFSAEQISAVLHATFRAVVAFPPRREQYNGTKRITKDLWTAASMPTYVDALRIALHESIGSETAQLYKAMFHT